MLLPLLFSLFLLESLQTKQSECGMYGLLFNELSGGQSARYPFINIPTGIPSPTGSLRCFTIVFSLSLSPFPPFFHTRSFLIAFKMAAISVSCVCVWEWGYKALLFFIVLLHSVSCARHLLLRRRSASRLCDSFFMIWLCAPVPYLFLLQTHLLAPVFVCRRRWALSVGRDFFFCGSPDAHTFVFDPHPSPWLSFRWPRFLPLSSRVRVYLARRMRIDFSYYCSGHDPRSAGGKTDRQLTVADEEGPGERERGFICRVIEMSSR